jgi:hypothetical protein
LLRTGGLAAVLGALLLGCAFVSGAPTGSGLAPLIAGLALGAVGLQLAGLGVIAGYLVRALEDARVRPLYVLKQFAEEPRAGEARLGIVREAQPDAARKRASH